MEAIDQVLFEESVDLLLSYLSPDEASLARRRDVSDYIEAILRQSIPDIVLIPTGSFPLKSYLPESDLDLVLLTPKKQSDAESNSDMSIILSTFNALCAEIAKEEHLQSTYLKIRNVEFVNARVKLTRCTVNNIGLDITVNQIGSLATLAFLEEADRCIGHDHLFKRSLLLVKSWCVHESVHYCGVPIVGSKSGALSTYAISVMVLHLFNKFTQNLIHPFSVLRCFLFTYSHFDWSRYVLTLAGPLQMKSNGTFKTITNIPNRFAKLQRQFKSMLRKAHNQQSATVLKKFLVRSCNIQDPVDVSNNIGVSVSTQFFKSIILALSNGAKHLEEVMKLRPNLPLLALRPALPVSIDESLSDKISIDASTDGSEDSSMYACDRRLGHVTEVQIQAEKKNQMMWFLQSVFRSSCSLYVTSGAIRADLKENLVQSGVQFSRAPVSMAPRDADSGLHLLDGDVSSMWDNFSLACEYIEIGNRPRVTEGGALRGEATSGDADGLETPLAIASGAERRVSFDSCIGIHPDLVAEDINFFASAHEESDASSDSRRYEGSNSTAAESSQASTERSAAVSSIISVGGERSEGNDDSSSGCYSDSNIPVLGTAECCLSLPSAENPEDDYVGDLDREKAAAGDPNESMSSISSDVIREIQEERAGTGGMQEAPSDEGYAPREKERKKRNRRRKTSISVPSADGSRTEMEVVTALDVAIQKQPSSDLSVDDYSMGNTDRDLHDEWDDTHSISSASSYSNSLKWGTRPRRCTVETDTDSCLALGSDFGILSPKSEDYYGICHQRATRRSTVISTSTMDMTTIWLVDSYLFRQHRPCRLNGSLHHSHPERDCLRKRRRAEP